MRFLRLLILAGLLGAGAALAQTPPPRPGAFVPPRAPAAIPLPPPSAPPASVSARLTLPDRADGAPACRAQCTRVRAVCEAADDACAPAWNACLQRCAAAK